jgi:transcriptional regulator with XRE-family HTH domain
MPITTAQIRGARGLLDWSQAELSRRTGISTTSIGNIESGHTQARESTLSIIRKAFEDGGIEFSGHDGIRKRSLIVEVLSGAEGVRQFSYDLYRTAESDTKRPILQAYVDDHKFAELLGDEAYPHVQRMEKLTSLNFKILQREGDSYFPAKNYSEYRWIPEQSFMAVPFFVYGDKLAIIVFDKDPKIIVINYPIVAEVYRLQFNALWGAAIVPPKNLIEKSTIPERYKQA